MVSAGQPTHFFEPHCLVPWPRIRSSGSSAADCRWGPDETLNPSCYLPALCLLTYPTFCPSSWASFRRGLSFQSCWTHSWAGRTTPTCFLPGWCYQICEFSRPSGCCRPPRTLPPLQSPWSPRQVQGGACRSAASKPASFRYRSRTCWRWGSSWSTSLHWDSCPWKSSFWRAASFPFYRVTLSRRAHLSASGRQAPCEALLAIRLSQATWRRRSMRSSSRSETDQIASL